jgi:hypothetical protein
MGKEGPISAFLDGYVYRLDERRGREGPDIPGLSGLRPQAFSNRSLSVNRAESCHGAAKFEC